MTVYGEKEFIKHIKEIFEEHGFSAENIRILEKDDTDIPMCYVTITATLEFNGTIIPEEGEKCPECGSTNTFEDHKEHICRDCGRVFLLAEIKGR